MAKKLRKKARPRPAGNPAGAPVDAVLRDAIALHQQGLLMQAQARYREILQRQPKHFDALHLSGVIALQTKDHETAVDLIGQAIAMDSGFAMAHGNLGLAQARLGRLDAAMASYDRAIGLNPDYADAYINRGDLLMTLRRHEAALVSYDKAIALKPIVPETYNNRGVALLELGRYAEALQSCDAAVAQRPNFAEAHKNRGNALKRLGRYEAAVRSYDQAIALKPDYVEACNNLGNALSELKRYAEALAGYDRALAVRPDYAEAHFGKANALLILGEFDSGWREYEWRWSEHIRVDRARNFSQPRWTGSASIVGKTILLYDEQGLGDAIQFARYAGLVSGLGARVVLEVQKPLLRLFADLNGVSQVLARGEALPPFDCHCPLLSLPLAFGTILDSIPCAGHYLSCDPIRVAQFRDELGPKTSPRIGLAWSGSAVHANDRYRSIPLSDFLAGLPSGYQYVCLQKEVRDADRKILDARPDILHLDDQLGDFSDTAALCGLMDVVISVDTSLAHLAGALGKEVRILLPFNPDWRWLLDRTDSPWYPSARLYRQEEIGQWAGTLQRLKADLMLAR